jgi:glycosyltransferase involved in cell wall biosynthesis
MKNSPIVSIVVPCFNEALRLPMNYWKEMISNFQDVNWIFVDDGSTDSTLSILNELCRATNAEVLVSKMNIGKGNAVRIGLESSLKSESVPDIVGYLDSDGAFSHNDVSVLIDLARSSVDNKDSKQYEVFILSRVALSGRNIRRRLNRHYLGRVIATLLSFGWNGAPYDTQSGFKIIRSSEYLRFSLQEPFRTRWFFDVELISRIGCNNNGEVRIWEEPATSWADIEGSKLRPKHILLILRELIYARTEVNQLRRISNSAFGD